MADPNLEYDPIDGWNNTVVFEDNPTDVEVRPLFQRLFTQIQTFINTTLIAWVNSTFATKSELSGIALGAIPDDSLTEAQMANEMKKSVTGGVESFNTANLHRGDGVIHVTANDRIGWNGKEPAITKLTAFNKNYSVNATDVKMNGVQGVGTADAIARIDHIHPADTSRLASNSYTAADVLAKLLTVDTNTSSLNAQYLGGASLVGGGTGGLRGTTLSVSAPSGGTDGDVWIKYI